MTPTPRLAAALALLLLMPAGAAGQDTSPPGTTPPDLAAPAPAAAPAAPAPDRVAEAPVPGPAAPPADRLLPFGADWARARGIDLPSPLGVGLFVVSMRRDIEVTDVRVTLPGSEPASVGSVASFAVHNDTTLVAAKVDAWLLPVLNVYLLAGHSWTDSRLDAAVTIDRPLQPPLVLEVTQDSEVGGPLLGGGATLVAGYGPWFIMADANYSVSDIAAFDERLGALFVSARTGWSGATGWGAWRGWIGVAWLETGRTLTVTQPSSAGPVVLEIDQRPVNPLTVELGGSLSVGKRWEGLLELGTNSGSDRVMVFSAAYRF
jgi:hypothetical protein